MGDAPTTSGISESGGCWDSGIDRGIELFLSTLRPLRGKSWSPVARLFQGPMSVGSTSLVAP